MPRLPHSFLVCALVGLFASSASAESITLDCQVTDYGDAKLSGWWQRHNFNEELDIDKIIVCRATHIVSDGRARLEETGAVGKAKTASGRIELDYTVAHPTMNNVYVHYTYIRSNGMMITRAKV